MACDADVGSYAITHVKEVKGAQLNHYLSKLNTGQIDLNQIVEMTDGFTPADIQYLFEQGRMKDNSFDTYSTWRIHNWVFVYIHSYSATYCNEIWNGNQIDLASSYILY